MLKLKIQNIGHLIWRVDSLGKTLMLEKIDGKRRRGPQRMRWLESITHPVNMNWSDLIWETLFIGFSREEYWSGLPLPSPVDHVLSELSTMTHPFWVVLHGMKDELPRLVCVQYVTGEEWRNNPRKNEEMEPKQKQHSAVDMNSDWNKSDAVRTILHRNLEC